MKKLALILCALGLLAAGSSISGSAASFDDTGPCPTTQGPLFVCPVGTVGVPYSVQIVGRAGCDLYWFRIDSGALPAGLTMSQRGLVSGTPTEAARTTPWLSIHDLLFSQGGFDWCGGDNQSERQFVFETFANPNPLPPPTPPLLWYWKLTAGGALLHSERAITYADGSTGLGKMLQWEQSHKDVIRVKGSVQLAHVQAAA